MTLPGIPSSPVSNGIWAALLLVGLVACARPVKAPDPCVADSDVSIVFTGVSPPPNGKATTYGLFHIANHSAATLRLRLWPDSARAPFFIYGHDGVIEVRDPVRGWYWDTVLEEFEPKSSRYVSIDPGDETDLQIWDRTFAMAATQPRQPYRLALSLGRACTIHSTEFTLGVKPR